MHIKSRIIKEVKVQLPAFEGLMRTLADKVKTSHKTINTPMMACSPQICLPHYVKEIRELLGIPSNQEISETYSINQPYEVIA